MDPMIVPPPEMDVSAVQTPAYVVDLGRLRENLAKLDRVQKEAGCKVLLALKGFAMWSVFPIIRETLAGVTCSSPHEAQLGKEEFGKETHAYAPAYSQRDIDSLVRHVDHIHEIESLLLRIADPQGNRRQGRLARAVRRTTGRQLLPGDG